MPVAATTTPTSGYRAVEFTSDGAALRGRLYLPKRWPAPVVVMAHGFSATIPMVTDRYADRFREGGFAVLAFDHRGHGSSDGHPRGEINEVDGGRFGLLEYPSHAFDQAAQAAWRARTLGDGAGGRLPSRAAGS